MAKHDAHANAAHGDHNGSHGSLKSYTIGFVLSIVLTIIPIVVVMNDLMSKTATFVTILIAAVLQFAIQLIFFMHLREEDSPRFNLISLVFGLVIIVTVVVGSIWIMLNNSVVHFH